MPIQTSYTEARAHLAELCDRVTSDREVVIVKRRGKPEVAIVSADELASLEETAHLLRSPANAARLLKALQRAMRRDGKPESTAQLRRDLGLEKEG